MKNVIFIVLATSSAYALDLTQEPVTGTADAPQAGRFTLNPYDGDRSPVAYRCAQTFPDLPLTIWTPITATPVVFTRLLPGFQTAPDAVVTCEVLYVSGVPMRVSVVEDLARRSGDSQLPRSFLNPSPGVLARLLITDSGYGAWPVVQYNDQGRSLMRYAPGNNFVPLEWGHGYAWSSEHTRGVDKGEPRPNTVIVAHVYARWLGPIDVMDLSQSSAALLVDLAGDDFDLHGGDLVFAVLVSYPSGLHARYHLRRPLTVRNDAWSGNGWYVPSGSHPDWWCSFVSNSLSCDDVPSGPDLRYIEAVEILAIDGTAPPTGVLKMRRLEIWP